MKNEKKDIFLSFDKFCEAGMYVPGEPVLTTPTPEVNPLVAAPVIQPEQEQPAPVVNTEIIGAPSDTIIEPDKPNVVNPPVPSEPAPISSGMGEVPHDVMMFLKFEQFCQTKINETAEGTFPKDVLQNLDYSDVSFSNGHAWIKSPSDDEPTPYGKEETFWKDVKDGVIKFKNDKDGNFAKSRFESYNDKKLVKPVVMKIANMVSKEINNIPPSFAFRGVKNPYIRQLILEELIKELESRV